MENQDLLNISYSGRKYPEELNSLSQYFSYAALMRYRVLLSIEWGILNSNLDVNGLRTVRSIYEQFGSEEASVIKKSGGDFSAILEFINSKVTKDFNVEFKNSLKKIDHIALESLTFVCMFRDFIDRELISNLSSFVMNLYVKIKELSDYSLSIELLDVLSKIEDEILRFEGEYNISAGPISYDESCFEVNKEFLENLGIEFNEEAKKNVVFDSSIYILFESLVYSLKLINSVLSLLMSEIPSSFSDTEKYSDLLSKDPNNISDFLSSFILSISNASKLVTDFDAHHFKLSKDFDGITKKTIDAYQLKISIGGCGSAGGCADCSGC